jgi:drug/metabolite transporter (DMT)-like permease
MGSISWAQGLVELCYNYAMKLSWLSLALLGTAGVAMMNFLIVVLVRRGVPLTLQLVVISITLVLFYSWQMLAGPTPKFNYDWVSWTALIAAGVLSAVGNYAIFQAQVAAPNAGLALAIFGLQAGVVAILAVLFLHDRINLMQSAGIILGLIAIWLINLGSRS